MENQFAATPPPDPLRLFIVEDSLTIRDLVIKNLTNIPGLVLSGVAETEQEALERLTDDTYDVLIVDIALKKGNGMSLLRTLTRTPRHADCTKIIFSNHTSHFYRRIGEQYGVRFFFDKSSEFLQMQTLLQKLAAHSSLE